MLNMCNGMTAPLKRKLVNVNLALNEVEVAGTAGLFPPLLGNTETVRLGDKLSRSIQTISHHSIV